MKTKSISDMTSEEIGEAVDRALKKVYAEFEAGTLDMSGRYYYTEEQLRQMRELDEDIARCNSERKKSGTAA